jgi:spore maturation protein CgeE
MIIDHNIVECELEYTKCFSEDYENNNVIRFRDDQLRDMYDHNYTYIKETQNDSEFKRIIEDEVLLRLSGKHKFCNIVLNSVASNPLLSTLGFKPELSTIGYYAFDVSQLPVLPALPGCSIKKVKSQEDIQDILYCDLQHDEEILGYDFCIRRAYRRGKVYVSDQGVDSYICYHNGDVIGNCDLFIHRGIAKIEDFAVIPSYQRKGYGTTIIKELIRIAIESDAHTVYLLTDEDDTAKEMYRKIGFKKIGERTDLFFEL